MQHRIEINQSLLDQILEDGTYRECILSALNVENRTRQDLKKFLLEKKSRAPNLSDKTFINSYDTEIRYCLSKSFIIKNDENQILSLASLGIDELKTSLIYQNNTNKNDSTTSTPAKKPRLTVNNNETSNEGLAQATNSDVQQLTTVRPQVTLKKSKDPYEKHILIILYEKNRVAIENLIPEVLERRSIKIATGEKACGKEIKNCRDKKELVKDEGGIFSLTKKGRDKAEKLVAFRQNMQTSSTPTKTLESIAPSNPVEVITHSSIDPKNRYFFMSNNTGRINIGSLLNQANDETPTEQPISSVSITIRDETPKESSLPVAPSIMSINRILN